MADQMALFDPWAPELVTPGALWSTVDPGEVGLDEQASWIWPGAVGVAPAPGWASSGGVGDTGAVGRRLDVSSNDKGESTGWWGSAEVIDIAPNRRIWWRRISRTVSLVVAVARTLWVVWLPVAALMVAGAPLVAAAVGTAVVEGVAGWRSGRFRAHLLGLPMAVTLVVFRWRWPRICSESGSVFMVHGAMRHPRLVDIEFSGAAWWRPWYPMAARIVMEPLAQMDEQNWETGAARLGRQLRFPTVIPLPVDSLTLELVLRRDRLPDTEALGVDVAVELVAPGPDRPGVGMGTTATGATCRWCWDEPTRTALFVGGGTGGGKTDVLNKAVMACGLELLAGRPVECIIIDPKALGDFQWAQSFARIVDQPMAMVQALAYVRAEVERRAGICKAAGVNSWLRLSDDDKARIGGRLVLMIDEYVSFANRKVMVEAPEGPGVRKGTMVNVMAQAHEDLQAISAMGRALGVNLIVATQHPIAEHMGPYGSTLIANLGARIGVGGLEPSGAGSLFGKSYGEIVSKRARRKRPGRMFFAGLSSDEEGDGPGMAQGWWATPEVLACTPWPTRERSAGAPAGGPVDVESDDVEVVS